MGVVPGDSGLGVSLEWELDAPFPVVVGCSLSPLQVLVLSEHPNPLHTAVGECEVCWWMQSMLSHAGGVLPCLE